MYDLRAAFLAGGRRWRVAGGCGGGGGLHTTYIFVCKYVRSGEEAQVRDMSTARYRTGGGFIDAH